MGDTFDGNSGRGTAPRSMRPDGLAASVAVLLAVSVVQRAVGFGRGVLFCRWLSPEELGHWEMAYSFLLLAAPIAVLGVPGSMGRYLERYRNRNQLHTFLRRTMAWTAVLAAGAVLTVLLNIRMASSLIFGQPDRRTMVALVALSLAAVVLHHFLEALFAALRKFRIVSIMQFTQSSCFAAISLLLLVWLPIAAESIVFAYGLACAISSLGTLLWMRRPVSELMTGDETALPHRQFWPPLLRFAVWVWVTNLLCHMFAVVDRYMIVHCSGMDHATALAQVGNYHSSRIVPLLFVSLADLLAGVVMPYLSHDWEAGQRSKVVWRMNLVLKLSALAMITGGVVVLWLAPWLFHVAFAGKYDAGLAVLPWTMAYSVGYGLLVVAQCYIWCAERTRIGSLPLVAGLIVNVLLNLVLLPYFGLWGAVVATTVATAVALVVLMGINAAAGLQLHWGMIVVCSATFCLSGGAAVATFVLGTLFLTAFGSRSWLSTHERQLIAEYSRGRFKAITALVGESVPQNVQPIVSGESEPR